MVGWLMILGRRMGLEISRRGRWTGTNIFRLTNTILCWRLTGTGMCWGWKDTIMGLLLILGWGGRFGMSRREGFFRGRVLSNY